jgi:hypothetical protein
VSTAIADIAAIEAYVMPKPARGQQVLWFPHANRTEEPEIAFAIKVGTRTLVIQTAGGVSIDTVRHIEDPKLQLNEHQRLSGAWAFPEGQSDAESQKQLVQLRNQMSALEQRVKALEKK